MIELTKAVKQDFENGHNPTYAQSPDLLHEHPISLLDKVEPFIPWEDVVVRGKQTTCAEFVWEFLVKGQHSDMQVTVGSNTFNCHILLLRSFSKYFLHCENTTRVCLPVDKVSTRAFLTIYTWMLRRKTVMLRQNLVEILTAANYLGIQLLIAQCWAIFDNEANYREDTAYIMFLQACDYKMDSLKEMMMPRISRIFLTVVATTEFLKLDLEDVCWLLSSNAIAVNTEVEVFFAVILWLDHDWPHRQNHILTVMETVRFALMPPIFVLNLINCEQQPIISRMLDPELKRLIMQRLAFAAIQLFYGHNAEEFIKLAKELNLEMPNTRYWVWDKNCPYHIKNTKNVVTNLRYEVFIAYLHYVQKMGPAHWKTLKPFDG